jgi:AcrR family transcriptional regulator
MEPSAGAAVPSPLTKARRDPRSPKARILAAARQRFGELGYAAATTRGIAAAVGIDISTLHYHWGDKLDLYEAVVQDAAEEIRRELAAIEALASGKPLGARLEIAIDRICDYLFAHPEVAGLILSGFFSRVRHGSALDLEMSAQLARVAVAMDLAPSRDRVPTASRARILAVWNTVLNFIAGENFFRPLLAVDRPEYVRTVKATLKFILVPAFDRPPPAAGSSRGAARTARGRRPRPRSRRAP